MLEYNFRCICNKEYIKEIGRVIVKTEKDKKREEIVEGVEYEPYFEIIM